MRQSKRFAVTLFAILVCTAAFGQRATEVYIPIGESPGVSAAESVIGIITGIEYEQHRMTVSTGGGNRTVVITPDTRYYIDKSSDKERNVTGSLDDCREGRRIEVYVHENEEAIWIKIAAN